MNSWKQAREVAMVASEVATDGQAAYLLTVETLLSNLLGGDLVVWNGLDAVSNQGTIAGSVADEWRWLVPVLIDTVRENPMAHHFLDTPGLAAPVRMSDLVDETVFRNGRIYAELWRPMGTRYQVGIPTFRADPGASRGWAINRAASDFTSDQLETLTILQPALAALEDLVEVGGISSTLAPDRSLAVGCPPLTPRESEVVDLVALGWTARHIAHHLRISPGTVRKHLEHIYGKLGTHDRLSTVLAIRASVSNGLPRSVTVS